MEDPGYASVHQVVHGLGLEPVPIAVDPFGVRPDALAAALDDGLAALIVTPRANNPCGAAFDDDRVAQLDAVLADHRDLFVIQDDHAGPIAGVPFVGLRRDLPRWAVVRSMAKSLGPDLRVALIAGDADTVAAIDDTHLARVVYDALAPHQARNAFTGQTTFWGAVSYHLGRMATVLGQTDDARELLDDARLRHDRMGAVDMTNRTLAALARLDVSPD